MLYPIESALKLKFLLFSNLQEVMQDPHVAADGFTYEAEALRGWLDSGHDTSPMTNLKLEHKNLVPNHALRSAIQEWLQKHWYFYPIVWIFLFHIVMYNYIHIFSHPCIMYQVRFLPFLICWFLPWTLECVAVQTNYVFTCHINVQKTSLIRSNLFFLLLWMVYPCLIKYAWHWWWNILQDDDKYEELF